MGVPLPWVGAGFYLLLLLLLLWAFGSRRTAGRARLVSLAVWMAVAAGAFSGMLMWVQFGVLRAFCGLCTASAVIVALLVWTTLRAEKLAASNAAPGSRGVAWSLAAVATFAVAGLALPLVVASREVVATVDGRVLTRAEMEADLAAELQPLRRSIYERELAWVQGKVAGGQRMEIMLPKPPLRGLNFDLTNAQTAGPRDARVQLVVFSDFTCDYCRKLAPVLEKVRAKFPNEVLVAFRPYPLDANPRARPAAIAAQCAAEQGQFWKYHDRLFAVRDDLSDERLAALAQEVGLDVEKFAQCRASGQPAQIVADSYAEAVKLGIEGAPALFLNGDLIGGYVEYEALAQRIRTAVKRK
jgi:protein-disulfide isomerase